MISRNTPIRVDTPLEILTNKVNALLSRSELRDLEDVRALVNHGVDLAAAVAAAPRKDAGFSPMTLVWVLRDFPVDQLGARVGYSPDALHELRAFRDTLVRELTSLAKPT